MSDLRRFQQLQMACGFVLVCQVRPALDLLGYCFARN
jgi:hypothetical protein